MRALNELLRGNPAARDEYLLRVELHSRLASDPDLFSASEEAPLLVCAPGGDLGDRNKLRFPAPQIPGDREASGPGAGAGGVRDADGGGNPELVVPDSG